MTKLGAFPLNTAALRTGFPHDLFVTDPDVTTSYARDRMGAYVGLPMAVAWPRSAGNLAAIMVRCGELGLVVLHRRASRSAALRSGSSVHRGRGRLRCQ